MSFAKIGLCTPRREGRREVERKEYTTVKRNAEIDASERPSKIVYLLAEQCATGSLKVNDVTALKRQFIVHKKIIFILYTFSIHTLLYSQ